MNSDLILSFVYSLNNRNIGIWVNEENIKLFIPEQESLSANDKQFIINNKTELIYLLSNNNILTYQDCFGILKSNISKLSFSQERLWFISQYDNSIPVYNIPRIYKLKIGVNVTHIKNSITKIVDEHEVLRTLIISDTLGNNKLSINKDVSDHIFNVYHLNSLEDLNIQIKTELSYIFNLAEENPIRVCFYHLVNKKTQIKEIYMSIIFHHIAADGWSMGIFSYELSKFYNAYSKDEMALIKENKNYLPIQYKDYATWQYYYLQGELLNKQLNFWKNYLAKYEQLNLPTDFPRPKEIDYVGNELNLILDKNLSVRLRHIAISNDISLYSLLLGGWYLLLNIYSNQSDILIGSVMANRRYANVDNIIGFFANTIAIRGKIDGKDNLLSYFKNITNDIIEIQNYQGLPFDLLIEELSVPRDMGYHPLFQIMFVLQNFGGDSEHYTNEILEDYSPTKKEIFAKFDLTVSWHDDGDNLTCNFNYRTSLFEQSTIEGYMQTYIKIIERMVEFLEQANNYLVSDVQKGLIEHKLSIGESLLYPSNKTLFDLFVEQAQRSPEAIAVIDANKSYSYRELQEDACTLIHELLTGHSLTSGQLVGILSEKGYNHAACTLGIMGASYAYLPLHHDWPLQRILDVLAQGKVNVLLISRKQYEREDLREALLLNHRLVIIEDVIYLKKVPPYLPEVRANDIAYVIFTSGSTGKPKGVTISHQGAINTIYAVNQRYSVDSSDVFLALSELSFDLSVYDLFGALSCGAAIVFPDSERVKEPEYWHELVLFHGITIWNSVPQLANLLVEDTGIHIPQLSSLRLFLLSGDWIPLKLPERIKSICLNSHVVSLGGATEGSIWSIWYEIDEILPEWKSIPYGLAMPNQQILVLNEQLHECPVEVVGEIVIGGDGVALNYWSDADKTAMSFIDHAKYGRLYKTGDLGKWSKAGHIDFIGRKDTQIKINGYRVEVDEVSAHISRVPGVKDAVVILVSHDDTKKLVAYYCGDELDETNILMTLAQHLPSYMVPARVIYLPALPLTSNGKVDKQMLPEPTFMASEDYVAPRNETEHILCEIYAKVLNLPLEKVGIKHDFFQLGGDSIGSIRLVSAIKKSLPHMVTAKDIFRHKTVYGLYESIFKGLSSKQEVVEMLSEQGTLTGEVPVHPVQKWFFNHDLETPSHWNHAFLVRVPKLEISLLQEALTLLLHKHDTLRIRYKYIENEIKQYYTTNTSLAIKYLDVINLSTEEIQNKLTEVQAEFDLYNGPVTAVAYLDGYADGSARVFFAVHHLLIDTVSWQILVNDLQIYYNTLISGNTVVEVQKGTSYRQWGEVLNKYSKNHIQERSYWEHVLTDYAMSKQELDLIWTEELHSIEGVLDSKLTDSLLHEVSSKYKTDINDILLTSLTYALNDLSGMSVHYITLEGHGREEIDKSADIVDTVGWFTSMYPVRLELLKSLGIGANIKLIKEILHSIPNKGVGYTSITGENPLLPKISFNYLGQLSGDVLTNWSILSEDAGKTIGELNKEVNNLTLNASIMDGSFRLSIRGYLPERRLEALCHGYIRHLSNIIIFLLNEVTEQVTMSDYPEYETHALVNEFEKDSLFMFPPGVGGYESYLNSLSKQFNNKLVMFNNFNHYLKDISSTNIRSGINFESLAQTYIAKMKVLQPKGPYRLFGWSFGGVLAFEIMKQLQQIGENVTHLFMVDPYFDLSNISKILSIPERDSLVVGELNLKYCPEKALIDQDTSITLFKALKSPINDGDNSLNAIVDYYTFGRNNNGLDEVLTNKFNLVPINSTHFGWIEDKMSVELIGKYINRSISIS